MRKKSRRYVSPDKALELRRLLAPAIRAVGVFTDEAPERVAGLLNAGVIDIAQLHGGEDSDYINELRALAGKPVIKAFCLASPADVELANRSGADYVLLDSGSGSGKPFDWSLLNNVRRPFFLAGGLSPDNVGRAVRQLKPYAVDVSSGIETDGYKDPEKMSAFVAAVRKEGQP